MAKQQWKLSESAFTAFLACLDTEVERAGEKYEMIRLKLIRFFDWRRVRFPEDLADETLNRVMRKIEDGAELDDVPTYCLGIARFVWRESLRSLEPLPTELEEAAAQAGAAPAQMAEDNPRQVCFEHCLRALPLESRQLILRYYQDERRQKIDQRLALAEQLGIPLNALRSRAQRIRDRLEQCVTDCLKKL